MAEEPDVRAFVTNGAEASDVDTKVRPLSGTLAASVRARPREESWRQLAVDLTWNYKSFLLGTDA